MEVIDISLDKQVMLYSVDTSAFYTDEEYEIQNEIYDFGNKIRELQHEIEGLEKNNSLSEELDSLRSELKVIDELKDKLKDNLKSSISEFTHIRSLRQESLSDSRIVSTFDSVFTRTLELEINKVTLDVLIVETFYHNILESIIENGFNYNGQRYIFYTASAGQTRTKKAVFIKESLFNKHTLTLMCGLTINRINNSKEKGMNINKFLAYLALNNSATDEWHGFDIDRCIVVDDFESEVFSEFDHIDSSNFEIERKHMDVPIEHTDGCGMILPKASKKAFMVRLPWVKGLLVPFPFDKFIREHNKTVCYSKYGKVKDIYGDKYDLIKDKIEIIFTKSQFKLWKYYESWDEYKTLYKLHKCQAGKTNVEEEKLKDAKIGYQMLQTLSDMTDDELISLSNKTVETIKNIGSDKETMLRVLGVGDWNVNKNYYQQALEIYPELLKDTYSKENLKNVKKKIYMGAKTGKLYVDGKFTFTCPDFYAVCENLILGDQNPKGLLSNGEVSFNVYDDKIKLDVLRSPHLYREHAVRVNKVNKDLKRWFTTKCIYTSCHDPISKILQFDVDGDKLLVCREPELVKIAERNMKDIVPLYYEMKKANPEIINGSSIYKGLKAAYTGGNIGEASNKITKVWNGHLNEGEEIDLDIIKIMVCLNNFVIDYAKTLYKPKVPKEINVRLNKYAKDKLPYFFKFDTKRHNKLNKKIIRNNKNKNNKKQKLQELKVEVKNNSVINRLDSKDIIPKTRLNFNAANLGTFNYKILMSNNTVTDEELRQKIIDEYTKHDLKKHNIEFVNLDGDWTGDSNRIYIKIRKEILEAGNHNIQYIVDVLVEYLYKYKNSNYKTTLWSCFGDVIVKNIKNNLMSDTIPCQSCGERTPIKGTTTKYCNECSNRIKREKTKERVARHRSKIV